MALLWEVSLSQYRESLSDIMNASGLSDYSQFFRAPRPRQLIGELISGATTVNNIEVGTLLLKASDKLGELGYAYREVARILAAIVWLNGGQLILPANLVARIRDFEMLDITDPDPQGRITITMRGAALSR